MDLNVLEKANLLNSKIKQMDKLLAQITNIDPTTNRPECFPITIASGMARTIDFELRPHTKDAYIDSLETSAYNGIRNVLVNYQKQLQKAFDELN